MKPNNKTAPAADTDVPSLEAILNLKAPERIALYQRCDSEMRSRFLIQGKVLHSLENGEELLLKAGIPKSSLNHARFAAAAMTLASKEFAENRGAPVMIRLPGEKKAIPFTEAIYDTLTLEECRLLCYGSTNRGDRSVAHKPVPDKFYAILEKADWQEELECVFEHGCTRAELRAQERNAKKLLEEEQARAAAAAQLQASATAPPPGPMVGAAPSFTVVVAPAAGGAAAEPEGQAGSPSHAAGKPDCTACSGSGLNSKGGPCHPCSVTSDSVGDTSTVHSEGPDQEAFTLSLQQWNEEFDVFAGQTRAAAANFNASDRAHVIERLRHLTSQLESAALKPLGKPGKAKNKVGTVPTSKKPGKPLKAAA